MKTIEQDPVCGMTVEPDSKHQAEYRDARYLFCSAGCERKFRADPEKYLKMAKEDDGDSQNGGGSAGERTHKKRQKERGRSWKDYIPLMALVAVTLLAASAKQLAYADGWEWMSWMHDFMGLFLVVFSMFKFFDLEGFADGFQMYDLLAKRFRPYAYFYPFLELGLGLSFLSMQEPFAVYVATVAVMVFGSLGVIRALQKNLDIECACMGTALSVPLSTVALVEDLGMAAMALAMIFFAS